LLTHEIGDEDNVFGYGAAGERKLFSIPGPGKRED
jgi:hypothetical protein